MIVASLCTMILALSALFLTEPPLGVKIVLIIGVIISTLLAYIFDLYRQFKIEELEKRIHYLEITNDEN